MEVELDSPRMKAIYKINKFIYKKADSIFVPDDKIKNLDDIMPQNNEEFLSIAYNQQKKIVRDPLMRRKLFPKLTKDKLQIWDNILEEYVKLFESFATSYNVFLKHFYFVVKSVITPKEMEFDDLINFLDQNFGEDVFPTLTYEDAVVIIFIKPIYPGWLFRLLPNYQKKVSRYINYLSFALKKVIEEVDNIEINISTTKKGIKTYSAAQNILLYLSNKLKID
ncbi:hypothetical protein M9Y10_032812 [Tritrichomonas musculus]|uniref:Uncharacterized protein n=1 Tax=Tritrichomonas musculus TaxID=1915356 RepID=A0ABR2GYP9_9EUKA